MSSVRWTIFLGFLGLDVALAGAVAYVFGPREPVVLFLAALGVLWLLPFLTTIWAYAKFWLVYWISNKRAIVRNIKADFHKNEFPAGLIYIDPDGYLQDVMSNEDLGLKTRYRAAFLLGEKNSVRTLRPMTEGMAVHLAYCQALEEYRP